MDPTDAVLFATERLRARRLSVDDASMLQGVFEAAGDHFLTITGRPEPDPDAAERELRASAATPGRVVALLERGDDARPVGVVGWWAGPKEPDLALLGTLIVVPAERRQGLAREALDGLVAHLADEGIGRLRTAVGAGDREKHALLESLGFAALDARTHVSLDRGRVMLAFFERET